ncbi:LamG-like jellyroll fold domain-containing protein [Paractinoplanes atraurantiacus]|uniref:Concanavalin A-like lectin/glucanases superfamily protein n=1 Tax=Paractinoplanes atraurantiacus TaxID=1036182 RepID=A0A285KP39_9ACTN|nr:LamG-like jellyroll fold domain-containing protein [Actinoplanes atraurantiacus]SNY74398.1 Concanavalin A-like lectin/glucanases superfamily protein [Actinoplanes atraurantiacus]
MRSCWFGAALVAVSTVAVALTVNPLPAHAPLAAPPVALAATPDKAAGTTPAVGAGGVVVARYAFNGRAGSIIDESGRGHTLRVISGHGGAVRRVVHGQGSALAFPGRCTARVCPHVALQTATSSADLNPGTRNIAFGAEVMLTPGQTSKGQNIVQKGYSTTSSQWKLQIDGAAGRPSCVLVDEKRPPIRMATSSVSVADGQWHSVECRRVATNLFVLVNGYLRGRTTIPAKLSITNDRPMSIGGKGAYADNDQFNGALDNVWVQIG